MIVGIALAAIEWAAAALAALALAAACATGEAHLLIAFAACLSLAGSLRGLALMRSRNVLLQRVFGEPAAIEHLETLP